MPNHVRTVIKMKKLNDEQILNIIAECTSPIEGKSGLFPIDNAIDFDKIIPEPRTEKECPPEYVRKIDKKDYIEPDKDRPWFNWYEWHCNYWGTKWNAYDGYIQIGKTNITFVFSTAWSPAIPIFHELARKYNCEMEVIYADEDLGSNCGKFEYEVNSDGESWYPKTPSDTYRFASRVWNTY